MHRRDLAGTNSSIARAPISPMPQKAKLKVKLLSRAGTLSASARAPASPMLQPSKPMLLAISIH